MRVSRAAPHARRLLLAALLFAPPVLAQPGAPRLVVQLPGACVGALRLGPREVPCTPPGATYSVLEDGRAFVLMPFGPDSGINFVGSRDSQPTPDTYHLVLDHLRIVSDGRARGLRARGECQARLSPTGAWRDLGCAARAEDGQLYAFRFTPR
jgi:hypothetical protein